MILKAPKDKHLLIHGDSCSITFSPEFDLIITSPPFFHPSKTNVKHGFVPITSNLQEYSNYVAQILYNAFYGLKKNRFLCIIKTDFWYKGVYTPVGYNIVESCKALGLQLHSHWIWVKKNFYSPYGPSFSNVFILGHPPFKRVKFSGVIRTDSKKKKSVFTSSEAEVFATIIKSLTKERAVILDPFLGKGAAIEAAVQTNRIGVGIEISTDRYNIAQENLKNWEFNRIIQKNFSPKT